MKLLRTMIATCLLGVLPTVGNATVVFDSWVSNDGGTGNYVVTVELVGSLFKVELTVNPWNAEALGIFFDLGDHDIADDTIQGILPAGEVSLFDTDTSSHSCGPGCNLNGLDPTLLDADGEWEWVLRLGEQGFDGIQTFNFELAANGLAESDFHIVGIRAQQLCDGGDTLPDGDCGGSDKSGNQIPEPTTLALIGIGLAGLGLRRRRTV